MLLHPKSRPIESTVQICFLRPSSKRPQKPLPLQEAPLCLSAPLEGLGLGLVSLHLSQPFGATRVDRLVRSVFFNQLVKLGLVGLGRIPFRFWLWLDVRISSYLVGRCSERLLLVQASHT